MISVEEAKERIKNRCAPHTQLHLPIAQAGGYVLAEAVQAALSLPPFRQSSMDGYALHHADVTAPDTWLPVVAEVRAGAGEVAALQRGTAVRILTGAPVPDGATAVVMQEKTAREGERVCIQTFPVAEETALRPVGQQIMAGQEALPKGTFLTPGAIGFLTSLNVATVSVHPRPSIGILVTGDELVPLGQPLRHGQVYESSSAMLRAALLDEGFGEPEIRHVSDSYAETQHVLADWLLHKDVILSTGGISVGTYDFVGQVLGSLDVATVFYKVRQRPGKPLFFGTKGDTLVFALPGNPASTLVCYYEYVLPALRLRLGRTEGFLRSTRLPIRTAYRFQGERDEFIKAYATDKEVVPLEGQESFVLRSFATANALIHLPAEQSVVEVGELVTVHWLPG